MILSVCCAESGNDPKVVAFRLWIILILISRFGFPRTHFRNVYFKLESINTTRKKKKKEGPLGEDLDDRKECWKYHNCAYISDRYVWRDWLLIGHPCVNMTACETSVLDWIERDLRVRVANMDLGDITDLMTQNEEESFVDVVFQTK